MPPKSLDDKLQELQRRVLARNPVKCVTCRDTGYIRADVDIHHPDFGKMTACPKCNRDILIAQSGLYPTELGISLGDISTRNRPGAAAMVKAAQRFIDGGFVGMFSIFGGYGNGKTTTLKAIASAAIKTGIEVRYMTMKDVMDYAREAFESQQAGDSDAGRINRIARTRLLIIDELDKVRDSKYTAEVQTHLFDARYRRAAELGTVLAWNGDKNSIGLPWVISRLSEYPQVENKDADMRPLIGAMK